MAFLAIFCTSSGSQYIAQAANSPVSADEEQAEVAAQFLKVLLANPRFGTAFDRVREFHLDRGSIGELEDTLCRIAGLPLGARAADQAPSESVEGVLGPDGAMLQGSVSAAGLVIGMLRLQHSEYPSAITALQRAAEQRAEDPVAHWYLGRALVQTGRTDDAVAAFERAMACRPLKADFIDICRELARTHQRAQNSAAARDIWQRLENEFPGDLRVKEQIASSLADEGRWQDALTRFEGLANETKDAEQRVQANLSASDLLIQLSRADDAVRLLESQLGNLDADSWLFREIRRRIEGVFRSRDDLVGLTNYYDAWITAHPEDVDAMGRMARILSLRNQSEAAAEWYSKALTLAPSNEALRELLIEQLVRDKKSAEAIAQYEQLAQYDAGNLDHIEDWGQLYLSRTDLTPEDRRANAAAVWETLLSDRNDDPSTLARVAGLMRRAELTDRAITLYELAIQKAPDEPQYREYLGEYLHRLQRADEALATWTAMAEGDRRIRSNFVRLAEVLNSFGVFEPALESMREACNLDPEQSDRLLFAKMLREAAELTAADLPAESPKRKHRDQLVGESLDQLTLAEGLAETPDEFTQILSERIKTLIVAGQLEEQTRLLAEELQSQKPGYSEKPGYSVTEIAGRWRTLALYQDAAEKLPEATASALKVVELEPQSPAGWAILADLYERTGRLGDAADAMRKLASVDRRGISDILKKIARLEVRLGRFEQALQAGRDVIKATPGNPDAYQFFADLCFEVGKPDDAMNALRQAVRVNPGDESSLRALAKTLSDEFHTAEAIELYWRAFDRASDLESQTSIIVVLSKLYLRTNQFEKLIQRLDLRARELNLPREMTRCIATAYREAGEFSKAREALERLLIDDTQNVSVLKELVNLAEREHNLAEAEDYQRQVVKITEVVAEQGKLVTLLENAGKADEATNLRISIAKSRTGRLEILREIESLTANSHESIAEDLCRTLLEQSSDDWEAMFLLREIFRQQGRIAEAKDVCRRIVRLNVSFDTPRGFALVTNTFQPSQLERTDTAESINDFLRGALLRPISTFGDILCACCGSLVWGDTPPTNDDLALVFSQELRSRHGLRPAAFLIQELIHEAHSQVPVTAEFWNALDAFLEETPANASKALRLDAISQRLSADTSEDERSRFSQVATPLLADLLKNAPEWLLVPSLRIPSEIIDRAFVTMLVEESLNEPITLYECSILIRIATPLHDYELIKRILSKVQNELTVDSSDGRGFSRFYDAYNMAGLYDLMQDDNDPQRVLEVLTVCWNHAHAAASPNTIEPRWYGSFVRIYDEEFGFEGSVMSDFCLRVLAGLDAGEEFQKWVSTLRIDSPRALFRLCLLRAKLAEELNDSSGEETLQKILAAEAMPQQQRLRFHIADSAARKGIHNEALLLADSLSSTDPAFLAAREKFALSLSLKHGRPDRAVLAATRLFGMPLSTKDQLELISAASKLGMNDRAAAIEARLGRGSETRQSILGRQLQTYISQGKNDLAGEAAWELLELASDGSLFSGRRPSDDRDDGGERLQAIKALGRLNRLQPIIDRYEEMLIAAPDSVALLEILAEFHEAAEQWPQLTDKRDRIALLSKKAPPSMKARAIELERSGDVSGACDVYLQILRSDPVAFASEMETYLQSFELAGRIEDLLKDVFAVGIIHFTEQYATIISAASLEKKAHPDSPVPHGTVVSLLAIDPPKTSTLVALLLEKPELISEEELVAHVVRQSVLTTAEIDHWNIPLFGDPRTRSTLSLLEKLDRPESFSAVLKAVTEKLQTHPEWYQGRIIFFYLQAKTGHTESARQIVRDMLADIAIQRNAIFLSELQNALSLLEGDWTTERIALLQHILNPQVSPSADAELMDESAKILGTLYETTGRTNDARRLVLSEVQRAADSASSGSRVSEEQIRRVLSAAERIQHSGYPLDAVSLLQSVTAHEVDQFADDLGEDKAIAFKSRFSASDRWARQQITAEKLVESFTMAVEESAMQSEYSSVDLLLELTGTTNSMTREESELKQLGLNSVLLSAIAKNSIDSAELREQLTRLTAQVLAQEKPDLRLLAVTAAFAQRTGNTEQLAAILARLQETDAVAELVRVQDRSLTTPATGGRMRIPEALRSQSTIALVILAKQLAGDESRKSTVETLLIRSAAAAHSSGNRLVQTAVLNTCSNVAAAANLPELAGRFSEQSAAAIKEQIESNSIGSATKIDIAHEIRTRLLKQP